MTIIDKLTKLPVNTRQIALMANIPADRVYKWQQGKSSPSAADIEKLENVFHIISNLSKDEIKKKIAEISKGKNGIVFDQEIEKPIRKIPVLGEAVAGNEMTMSYSDKDNDIEYIDIGDFLRDSEAAFSVYGNSMNPNYPSGCILGITRCFDGFIQPGETYLLVTKSNRLFKRLYYNSERTKYRCVSDNVMKYEEGHPLQGEFYYPPFELEFSDVVGLYDVTGMIRRNRNSNIIPRQR